MRQKILSGLDDIDPARLNLLDLELTSEDSIANAAESLSRMLPNQKSYIHTAFFTGGILHPERQPSQLDAQHILDSFKINVISHLLMIKHFSRFLPPLAFHSNVAPGLAKWVHISARVGSVSDNQIGGWYSYRASKAALNQVIRTFDIHIKAKNLSAICAGVHPGTVKTDMSKDYWSGVKEGKLFEPEFAAERLAKVVEGLEREHRGRIWDWAGKEILP
ncbi:hypothetical protein EW026_g4377 [Hermanssonia centrifuga]|uniref:C-factor n=1 Tax=Hermanssonia centrifuga TaxID=98765 RepID=A0A4S4KH94_9APHY|nr:hypothetical protein EW026_g4377 [Hermanssonia centrifuga]